MRGNLRRLALPLAALVVLIAAGTAGGASKAGTLVFAGTADPAYLDPALASDGETFRATEQMMEGLVKLRPGTTKVIPALATKWKLSGAGKVWTFWLRKGVKFHDNTAWNAAAACANFNRWYNWTGPFQDPSATFYYQATYGGFKKNEVAGLSAPLFRSCKTVGALKIVVRLNKTSGVFFPSLVIQSFAMQSPTAMKKYGADQGTLTGGAFRATGSYAFQHPTGTGPFKFRSWQIGQKVELVKNKNYWGPKAKLDKIVIRPISDNQARISALKTGEVNAFDLAPPQDLGSLTSDSRLKVLKRPAFNVAYVTIHQGPGLADERPEGPPGSRVRPQPCAGRAELLLRNRPRGARVHAAEPVRLLEQGQEVRVQPDRRRVSCSTRRAATSPARWSSGTRRRSRGRTCPTRSGTSRRSQRASRPPASTWSRTARRGGRRTYRR